MKSWYNIDEARAHERFQRIQEQDWFNAMFYGSSPMSAEEIANRFKAETILFNNTQIKHMNYLLVAQVAHAVNRAYCFGIGDTSQKSWEEVEQWQRDSAVKSVEYEANNLSATPEDQHEA